MSEHSYWWHVRRELDRVDWRRELIAAGIVLAVSFALWWLFG